MDLGEEEHIGSVDHKDICLLSVKVRRTYKNKNKDQLVVQRSVRIKILTFIQMKDGFWNSEGIRDLAKPLFIHELVREHRLNLFSMLNWRSREVLK